jgi:hypothetical protein
VIGVTEVDDVVEDRVAVAAAIEHEKMTYPTHLDLDAAWAEAAGVDGIPGFVVLAKDGAKLAHRRGRLTVGSAAYEELVAAIEAALR